MRKDALLEKPRQKRKRGNDEKRRGVYGDRRLEKRDVGEAEEDPL